MARRLQRRGLDAWYQQFVAGDECLARIQAMQQGGAGVETLAQHFVDGAVAEFFQSGFRQHAARNGDIRTAAVGAGDGVAVECRGAIGIERCPGRVIELAAVGQAARALERGDRTGGVGAFASIDLAR